MGFISLLLTVLQDPISKICISKSVASTWHPCANPKTKAKHDADSDSDDSNHRKLLEYFDLIPRRVLATKGYDKCHDKASSKTLFSCLLLHPFSLNAKSQFLFLS